MINPVEDWILELWRKDEPIPIRIGDGKYKGSVGLFPSRYLSLRKSKPNSYGHYSKTVYRKSDGAIQPAWLVLNTSYDRFCVKILDKEVSFVHYGGIAHHSKFVKGAKPKLKINTPPLHPKSLVDRLGNKIEVGTPVAVYYRGVLSTGVVTRIALKVFVRLPKRKTELGVARKDKTKAAPPSIIKLHKGMFNQLLMEKLST